MGGHISGWVTLEVEIVEIQVLVKGLILYGRLEVELYKSERTNKPNVLRF